MTETHSASHVLHQLHAEIGPPHNPHPYREPLQSPSSIPATPDGRVDAGPCADTVVPADTSPFLDVSLPQPDPLPSALPQPLKTPILEDRPHLELTVNLPSHNVSLPTPTVLRTTHTLRLPSFDVLGIAAPHPVRMPQQLNQPFSPLGVGPLSQPGDPLHALSPPPDFFRPDADINTPATTPKTDKARVSHLIPAHTPPSDSEPGTTSWRSIVNVSTASLGSPPTSDPGASPRLNITASATAPGQAPIIVPTHDEFADTVRMAAWVEKAKNIITTQSGCLHLSSVKILSHALPCPSLTGHIFGQIITSIHDRSSAHTSWINVFHALPGRYTLSDLPKSPPSTPGPAVGGDSYFTSKVFDSAVAIPDYQLESKLLPPSPHPVVPPGSINVSIVERYIPPTNTNEFAEMFTFQGRSLVYDRLIELSTDDGILLFIYPTRTGAKTFMQQYLGPILDPLLRTVTVVHDLHSELGRSLGQMSSVHYLDEYDRLEAQFRKFCHAIGERHANTDGGATYEVMHAAKEEILLDRSAWADDWWVKQEKPRVRDLITKYFTKSKKLPGSELSGPALIEAVLKGVSEREYYNGEPTKGVEVGIFIVKKSSAAKQS
ncbi:hypothetical protein BDW02DRAFT_255664 [Decorospora gaudefroyi]|uniref:Uncharacterized protein n=1 Tax=Decorospora gaudefroyi TaxID=184978 RepID=A0A6A5JWH4_9PLEO|nr:hypothetical protein BDW02DRAFT_255664 [Decorospora gaudefroyi]